MTVPCMTCTLNVYDRNGVTLRGSLTGRGVQITVEHGMEGGAQLTGPMWEAALRNNPALFRDGIVKVATDFGDGAGEVEFAAFLTSAGSGTLIGDAEQTAKELSPAGRGLLALYGDARLAPEKGWKVHDLGDDGARYFGPMFGWFNDTAWATPKTQLWFDDPTARAGFPFDISVLYDLFDVDKYPHWIAVTDPVKTSVPAGTVNWFRKKFTLNAATEVKLWFTADNFVRVWIDSEQVGDLRDDPYNWKELAEWSKELPAGTYTICARVENAARTKGGNPIGFLATLWSLDTNGNPKKLIVHTDATWKCVDGTPPKTVGMSVGAILRRLRAEAFNRGLVAVSRLLPTFTDTHDSAGVAWPVEEERSWPLGTNVLDIINELSETSVDVEAAPSLALNAWVERGRDRTGVTLVPGHNIVSYGYDTEPLTGTRAVVKTDEGYVVETNAAAETSHDPREDYFEAGGAQTLAQGRIVAKRSLDDSSRDRIVYNAEIIAMGARDGQPSCLPLRDFNVGDRITGLDLALAPTPLVVTAITGDYPEDGGPWRWTLELEEP